MARLFFPARCKGSVLHVALGLYALTSSDRFVCCKVVDAYMVQSTMSLQHRSLHDRIKDAAVFVRVLGRTVVVVRKRDVAIHSLSSCGEGGPDADYRTMHATKESFAGVHSSY